MKIHQRGYDYIYIYNYGQNHGVFLLLGLNPAGCSPVIFLVLWVRGHFAPGKVGAAMAPSASAKGNAQSPCEGVWNDPLCLVAVSV